MGRLSHTGGGLFDPNRCEGLDRVFRESRVKRTFLRWGLYTDGKISISFGWEDARQMDHLSPPHRV